VAAATPIHGLGMTPAGTHVLTAADDKTVKLWNTANGANERAFAGAEGAVNAVTVSKNGILVATGGADKAVRVYNFADGKLLGQFTAPAAVHGLAFSPNNLTLAAACDDKSLVAWNVSYTAGQPVPADFGKVVQTYAHGAGATDVVFAPDSAHLYSGSLDKSVKEWKFASDAPVKNFAHPNYVDAVAFNPAGTLLATGCHDGIVRIWDVPKAAVLKQINAHIGAMNVPAAVYCVAWSPDGKQLVSGSLDRSLKLWDATSGAMVREFKPYKEKDFEKGHRDGVFCVAFSPDGKLLVSGSSDHTIKMWNVADGSVVQECVNPSLKPPAGALPGPPQSHPGWVYGVRFTSDGKLLVSAGNAPRNQGYVAVWNAADAKMLSGQELPLGHIYSVAIAPDGKLLALGAGPRGRQLDDANGYLLKMPEAGK
jgi:WD40 repeat protein